MGYVSMWIILLVFCGAMMLTMYCILRTFKATLLRVYTVFLSLKEPTIRRIHQSCRNMLRHIISSERRSSDSDEPLLEIPKNDEDENELEKVKHFRVSSSLEDSTYYFRMACPMLPLLALSVFLLVMGVQRVIHYNDLKQ
jgi:hypothetical protein